MSQPRDTQKNRVYRSESDCLAACRGIQFATIEDARDYVAAVCKRQWFRTRFGVRCIGVKKAIGCTSLSWVHLSLIKLSKIHMYEEVALHEIAHIVSPKNTAFHGPEFCGILLSLVERFMGKESALALRTAMQDNRVAYGYVVKPLTNPQPSKRST